MLTHTTNPAAVAARAFVLVTAVVNAVMAALLHAKEHVIMSAEAHAVQHADMDVVIRVRVVVEMRVHRRLLALPVLTLRPVASVAVVHVMPKLSAGHHPPQ